MKLATGATSAATRRSTWRSRRCGTPPTRTRPPAVPTSSAGIYPTVATITAAGFRACPTTSVRRNGVEAIARPRRGADLHEHAVLRRARADDEGPGRLRPQGHRPRSGHRRRRVRRRHRHRRREPVARTLHKISEIYDRIAFAGVGKYNEFEQLRVAGVRHADLKGYQYSRERRRRPQAWPTSTPRSSARSSPTR